MSHHIIIYGFPLLELYNYCEDKLSEENNDSDEDVTYEQIKNYWKYDGNLFKHYSLPMYGGDSEDMSKQFIGFCIDSIYGIMDNYKAYYSGHLQFSTASVPEFIKDEFKNNFPEEITPKCYALIQNVYTSHYCYGSIIYAYEIDTSKLGDEVYDIDIETIRIKSDIYTISKSGGHNMEKSPDYFIGNIIEDLETCEDHESCEKLADQLMKPYHIPMQLSSKSELINEIKEIDYRLTLSKYPVLTFIECMCYCCT